MGIDDVLFVFGWAVLGLVIGAAAWLLRPAARVARLPAMLLLSMSGAQFGGWVSWIFWDFPTNITAASDLVTLPALLSDCLAAFAALVALSLAVGAAMARSSDGANNRSSP